MPLNLRHQFIKTSICCFKYFNGTYSYTLVLMPILCTVLNNRNYQFIEALNATLNTLKELAATLWFDKIKCWQYALKPDCTFKLNGSLSTGLNELTDLLKLFDSFHTLHPYVYINVKYLKSSNLKTSTKPQNSKFFVFFFLSIGKI